MGAGGAEGLAVDVDVYLAAGEHGGAAGAEAEGEGGDVGGG